MAEVKGTEKLPEGWKRGKIGDLIIENPKSHFNVEDADMEGNYLFFTSGEQILKHNEFIVDGENIFIGDGGASSIYFYDGKASYSNHVYSIKTKQKIINKLLYFIILKDKDKIVNLFFTGTGLKNLNKPLFKQHYEIIFPENLAEQHKIAEILETVDKAIEKTDRIIEKYKRIKQGLMQDLLTRGIDENGNIRSEKTHRFKDSPLGRIPEEWEVVRLERTGEIITGSTPPTENLAYYGDCYQFITPEDIEDNKYIYKTNKMLSELGFKIQRRIPPKSICVVCIGSTIGKVALTTTVCSTNQQVNTIIPNYNLYDPEALYYFVKRYAQNPLRIEAGLQAVPIVNKSKFSKIQIPLPPLPEQHRIASILSQIDETIEKEQKYKEKLERIKRGLMEDLLTGKVRVNHLIEEDEKLKALKGG